MEKNEEKEQLNVFIDCEIVRDIENFANKDKRTKANMTNYLLTLAVIQYKKGIRL